MNTQAELREAIKRLKEASEKKQSEHLRKIYEEAGSDPVLSDYLRQLEQDEHFLPESEPALQPQPTEVSYDSGIDFMFPTGQLKSKKKHSKKKHSKKKHSKKKRSKKKRSKKRRSRKY